VNNKFSKSTIESVLRKLNIKKNDDLMIHGDAGVVFQYGVDLQKNFDLLFKTIKNFIGNQGTILIPSFTPSFCKKKIFSKDLHDEEMGSFGKILIKKKNFKRTAHPIFSFLIKGQSFDYYNKAALNISFGHGSIFDLFHKKNGKILVLGNAFEKSAAFLHHIEETAKVNYRFYKYFSGFVLDKKNKKPVTVSYFVRKKNHINSLIFKKSIYMTLHKANFGRFETYSTSSSKLYNYCIKKLKNNKDYLIK